MSDDPTLDLILACGRRLLMPRVHAAWEAAGSPPWTGFLLGWAAARPKGSGRATMRAPAAKRRRRP